ncbi:uncharacterized protein UTRI_06196 [Ustilago trichophora]|uniref:Secreted protein n=1 Tax=Ustilago trichophora TaxID=86804 RepID=A0A5C3EHM9_9BASI|nr:uncharacterized protein UTRI_06196 [Ustilago trichophora]
MLGLLLRLPLLLCIFLLLAAKCLTRTSLTPQTNLEQEDASSMEVPWSSSRPSQACMASRSRSNGCRKRPDLESSISVHQRALQPDLSEHHHGHSLAGCASGRSAQRQRTFLSY